MTAAGWITMIGALGGVFSIATWCFVRVLGRARAERDDETSSDSP
ncbi:MAG: hypothetical protein R3B72_06615 [Polyangiaceae bacterium]